MVRLLLLFSILFVSALAKTAEEWRTRSIYQIVTDRFARHDGLTPECTDLLDYCGGTFKGIENNLDYIQGMGFDAIWISPVMENGPTGYHGYWSTNFYEINPHFGTKQDLLDLIQACHDRDIWIMVDTVPNHVAPVDTDGKDHDFSEIVPFNDRKYYHWPILPCRQVFDNDPYNQTALEICWLWKLPDLKHEDPYVSDTLLAWIQDFIQTYAVDGLRIDAVRHVPLWFWTKFCEASGVFTVGEVWFTETKYVAQYQTHMDSLLNFPLHEALQQTIRNGKSMTLLSKYYEEALAAWKDITVLGNFVGNHDLPRFLNETQDLAVFKAFYAYILTSVGIPMVYYGDEQQLTGGIDPANREPLWGKMDPEAEMYQYIKTILKYKKESQYHNYEQIERFVDDHIYTFTRGDTFFAFTNSEEPQTRIITSHPYLEDTYLCNIFNAKECVEVRNGEFPLTMLAKQVQIFTPHENPDLDSLGRRVWKNMKQVWSNIFVSDPTKVSSLNRPDFKR